MIVRMKKATVITRREEKQDALRRLRKLGLLHLIDLPAQVPSAQEWREKKILLEKALAAVGPVLHPGPEYLGESDLPNALTCAQSILDTHDTLRALTEEQEALKREALRLREWDDISAADLQPIQDQGFQIRFYELTSRQIDLLPSGLSRFVIKRDKTLLRVALIMRADTAFECELKALTPPQRSRSELVKQQDQNQSALKQLHLELDTLGSQAAMLQRAADTAGHEIELAEAAAAMGHTEVLSYLSGFLPADQTQNLKKACIDNNWGLLLLEPTSEDEVPTIVRNKRWIDIISPVFQLLGTVPGYREFDISLFFLFFFAFFFAVIIGDAGYGLVLLSATLAFILRLRLKGQEIPNALLLMLLMSASTVVWGAVTGTWFGSKALASLPWLSWMTIPAISTFAPHSGETIKYICFITGTIHISIAHLWNFIRQTREKPFIRSFAQLGWLFLVLGLYYLVLSLVLSSERYPLPSFANWLIGSGLTLIIVFSRQEGRFFHGIAMGVANLLTTFLSSISAFSDIISYIRLFAVGLATVEIAKSFNDMASGMANGAIGIILASLVLLLGHSLNLAMGALSVVVHGVRLNMLEFSGHLGMEWTGRPYKPFKE